MDMKRILGFVTSCLLAVSLAPASAIAGAVDMGCSPTVANPCSGGSTGGGSSGAGELGAAFGQALGQMIGDAIRGNPEEDARKAEAMARQQAESARRRTEEEAERRRAEEQELKRHEEMKNRLLGNMMDVGDSSQPGLTGADSGSGLGLMIDDIQVSETKGGLGSTEVKHARITSPPAESGLQLLGDDEAKNSRQAGQGFDASGRIMGARLPPPPPAPSIAPAEKLKILNTLKDRLKKSEAKEQALKNQLEQLQKAPTPDPVAISKTQEKIVANEKLIEAKKKTLIDMTAEDPDAEGANQSSGNAATSMTSPRATAAGASH